ncbi:MAG: LysR family transcriptional regulator [Gemmatimonadaceae bacterium]|nr:LysR family transcriptional regulator [Gemmatimonadaceae bacterium]
MLDALSLDQLRTFVAAADEGNFSAAGRRLRRSQSVISQTIMTFEALLGIALFERSGRYPRLTSAGQSLLLDAKAILGHVDSFKARAKGISTGVEPELSVVIDVMFPLRAVTHAARAFSTAFPAVPLRIFVEALGAVLDQVVNGNASFGIIGSLPDAPDDIRTEPLLSMLMVMVASPQHPLASIRGVIPQVELAKHTQLILTDRTARSEGRTFGIMSPNVWKLGDLGAKHFFLLDGLGWGAMPMAAVEDDLAAHRLVRLRIEHDEPAGVSLPISVAFLKTAPPGPAGRWFIDKLQVCSRGHDMSKDTKNQNLYHNAGTPTRPSLQPMDSIE